MKNSKSGELRARLTAQLSKILEKYNDRYFGDVVNLIRKDCEDFLVSIGIQRALLPEIDIWLAADGFVEIRMHDYGIQRLDLN